MTKLTKTQQQVLDILRNVRAKAEALIPAINARAIGGLTSAEIAAKLGVIPDGQYISNIATQTCIRVPGANIHTFHALARAGHVQCVHGAWVAKLPRERLCTPMTVGEAAIAASTVC